MSFRLIRNTTFTAALLATSAIVAPAFISPALAADATSLATSNINLAAPFQTQFVPAFGLKVRISIARNAAAEATDLVQVYALLYNAGTYVGRQTFAPDTAGDDGSNDTFTQSVTLPTSGYDHVAFVVLNGTGSDDTYGSGGAANDSLFIVDPSGLTTSTGAVGIGLTAVTIQPATYTLAGATAGQLSTIGNNATVKAAAMEVSSAYHGPLLTAAQDDDPFSPTDIKLTFDTQLSAIADTSVVPFTSGQATLNGNTVDNPTVHPAVAAGDMVVRADNSGAAFTASIASVTIGNVAPGANQIQDQAGNIAATVLNLPVTQFAEPAYSTSNPGQVAIETAGLTDPALWTDDGQNFGGAPTIDVTIRMKESIGSGFDSANDIAVSNGLSFNSVQMATGTSLVVRLDLASTASDRYRFNRTSGQLEYSADSGSSWTGQDIALAVETGSEITTDENKAIATQLADVAIVAGERPAATLATLDSDGNGRLDGGQFDFIAPLATPLGSPAGVEVADDDATQPPVTPTLAADAGDPADVSTPVNATHRLTVVAGASASAAEANLTNYLEPTQSVDDNLNTGVVGGGANGLPFTVAITSSEITYASIFNPTDGSPAKLADFAAAPPTIDGAKPVVRSATFIGQQNGVQFGGGDVTQGNLEIVASEALANPLGASFPGDLHSDAILFDGSPLQLLNLNATIGDPSFESNTPSTTDTTNDTAVLQDVSADVVDKIITFSLTSPSGIVDAAGNAIRGNTATPISVARGARVSAGPAIVSASAIRSDQTSTNLAGNITSVVVVFDKQIQLGTGSTLQDGMFRLQVELNNNPTPVVVNIPAANVLISGATATLTIPAPGIPGGVSLTDMVVEYNAVGTNEIVSADPLDPDHPAIVEQGTEFDTSANSTGRDNDTSEVAWQFGGAGLYAMEFKGTLKQGVNNLPDNTLVQADLVTLDTDVQVRNMNVNVPCDCTTGTNVAVNDSSLSGLASLIKDNLKIGKTTTTFYLVVTLTPAQEKINAVEASVSQPPLGNQQRLYQVTIDNKTGAINGNGIKGTSVVGVTPPFLTYLCGNYNGDNGPDCGAWAMVRNGTFRVDLSVDQMPTNGAFIIASYKRPDEPRFNQFTSAVTTFSNYVPFVPNVGGPGALGVLAIDTDKLVHTYNDNDVRQLWDIVPFTGNIAFSGSSKDVDITRLLITTSSRNGGVYAEWLNGGLGDGELDQAFTLVNNVTVSALQIQTATDTPTLNNIKTLNGGMGLALFSEGTGITYPITGTPEAPLALQAGKWSLVTFETEVTDLAAFAATHGIGAVVVAGANEITDHEDQQFVGTFFAGQTDNSLTKVAEGQAAFIFSTTGGNFNYGN
jgi:hypothetical protein